MTTPQSLIDAHHALERVTRDLAARHAQHFSSETVRAVVEESYRLLSDQARIRTHLVPLAARFAGDRLRSLARAEGLVAPAVPQVLFVCVQNAGRSQMAAALLERRAGARVEVRSAGSTPASDIHPTVLAAMDDAGVDLTSAYPKPLTADEVRAADVVVTMGCGDACPVYPDKRYLNWELSDPSGADIDAVAVLRDEIDAHVVQLLDSLGIDPEDHS